MAILFSVSINSFAQVPTISSFSPVYGPVGTSVVISGTNFDDTTPSNNIVFFGATQAIVNGATTTELTVTVPFGATLQPISVLTNNLIAYSTNPFIVTFGGTINSNTYSVGSNFPTGTTPYSIAAGDLDDDGRTDFVVANHADNSLSIYQNSSISQGSITYNGLTPLVTGTNPIAVAIGDLDGDGRPDLAVTNFSDHTISVFRNISGPGTIAFDDKQDFPTDENPRSIVIGDMDLDGKADLATANYQDGTVSLLLNIGSGVGDINFDTNVDINTNQSGTYSIAIGDLDLDGDPDLVATNYFSPSFSAFENSSSLGTLSFEAPVNVTTGSTPYGITIADIDGDEIGDVIVVNQSAASVSVFRNTTVSSPLTFDSNIDFAVDIDANAVAAGDLDGDGQIDLAVVNQNTGTVSVLVNTSPAIGSVGFASKTDVSVGAGPLSVAIADANNDGKVDLFVANGDDNTVTVVKYVSPPPAITSFTPSSGAVGATVTINGLNFDPTPSNNIVFFGATKGVVSGGNSGQLSVVVPAGATYEPITVIANGLTAYSAYPFITTFSGGIGMTGSSYASPVDINTGLSSSAIFVGDLDGDGKADAVTVNPTDATFTVFINNSPAGAISFTHSTNGTSTDALDVALSDLDGDGRPDIIMTNVGDDRISIYENTSTPGSFSFGTTSEYAYAGDNPFGLAVADFDNDGKNDLAVANSADNTVSVIRNITNGINGITFATSIDYATGAYPQAVATGDFDGDGRTDIAVVNNQDNTVSIFRNTTPAPGSINFTPKTDYSVGTGPVNIAAGDLDNDYKIDLVIVNRDGNNMTTLGNNSSGPSNINFGSSTDFTTGTTPESVAINDLNGDGKPDVAVANSESNSFSVFVNTNTTPGSLTLAGRIDYGTGSGPKSAAIGDFDGDGKNDIVVTNSNDGTFSAYRRVIPAGIPTISFLNPESGPVGSFVIIGGTNFDPNPFNNIVKFNGVTGSPSASTATSINIKVPAGATTGFVTVTVGGNTATSNKVFAVGAPKTVSTADSLALVALYNSTSGSGWTNKTNWLTGAANTWYGVSTDANRVSSLNLAGNNLNGAIPPAIGNLTQITALDLSGNKLSGPIPSNVGNLMSLTSLLLQSNELSGSIPPQFNNLDQLTLVAINNNSISNLPDLSGMASIISLDANQNQLEFDDILPNIFITNFFYCCQKNTPQGGVRRVDISGNLTLSASVGGAGNVYQWKKFYQNISGATNNNFEITSATINDAGSYFLEITNPGVPTLTLRTNDFIVEVMSPESANDSGYKFYKKMGAEALGIAQQTSKLIATNNAGNIIYVYYSNTNKVVKYDANGNQLLSYTPSHNAFASNGDMSVDASDALYVTTESAGLVKFDASGNFVSEIAYTNGAYGNAIDASDYVYYLPRNSAPFKVQKYSNDLSTFIEEITLSGQPTASIYLDLEVDGSGNIYACEPSIPRIDKFSSTGAYISSINLAAGGVQMWSGWHFTIASTGDIYLQTFGQAKTYRFNSAGAFVSSFGSDVATSTYDVAEFSEGILTGDSDMGLIVYNLAGTFDKVIGPQRNANGQFNSASQIAQDLKGYRYIADKNNHRIQKLDAKGNYVSSFGTLGSATGQFNKPVSVATDKQNNIYVVDNLNDRIQKFTSSGTHLLSFGSTGSGDGQFSKPVNVAVSKAGDIVVADNGNSRIQLFKPDGTFILAFGSIGTGPGQFTNLQAIAIEADGTILVSDNGTRLQRFTPAGVFISQLNMQGPVEYISNLAIDIDGAIYIPTQSVLKKFDKKGELIADIGSLSTASKANGELLSMSVSSNMLGDTLWIADNTSTNRISIFAANAGRITSSDSLALVDLYNSTKGADWKNKTNWLTSTVDTWYGVNVRGSKVRQLNLPNNALDGTLPPGIVILDNLTMLNLNTNKLTGSLPDWNSSSSLTIINVSNNQFTQAAIPAFANKIDLSHNKLTDLAALPATHLNLDTLLVSYNQLDFGDLEPNITIKTFSYSPQDSVDTKESVLRELNESQTFTASIGGTSNVYQWKKNGSAISGAITSSLAFPAIAIADDAEYNYEATNTLVPGLTLLSNKKILRVSSLRRDSLALCALFKAAGGTNWINSANWISTPLGTGNWFGVTITNNRVSALNLPKNNLTGSVPQIVADVLNLSSLDLSGNKIQHLPDLKALIGLSTLNVSNNELDFASLIPNSTITGVNYQNQADIGIPSRELVDYATNYTLNVSTKGQGNQYQWKRNGASVEGAIDSTYVVASIGRANMGEYISEITNPAVPNLKLKTAPRILLAVASLSGKLKVSDTEGASQGIVRLLRIEATGGYDTLQTMAVNSAGEYLFSKVVLDDYQISGFADTLTYARALPTYYESTFLWELADTLFVNSNLIGLDIISNFKPTGVDKGAGIISGSFEEQETGGRTEAAKRVAGAGASVRRVEGSARPLAEKLSLVAYVFTNDEGEFVMPDLPKGEYRLNIQYPGYPMDETSFINMTIGDGLQSQVRVAARVEDNKIKVNQLIVTGLWEKKGYSASAYPNPTASTIYLQFENESASRKINLIDMTGREIHTQNAEGKSCSVGVQSLNTGIYLLNVYESDTKVKSIRVSVER